MRLKLHAFNSRLSLCAAQPILGKLLSAVEQKCDLLSAVLYELETRDHEGENRRPVAARTEGRVSVQRNHRDEMKRSVWFDERKGGIEKRPPIGCEGQSWEETF